MPELLAAVWVGFDDQHKLGRGEAGAKTALPIWIDFMTKARAGQPVRDFAQPREDVGGRRAPAEVLVRVAAIAARSSGESFALVATTIPAVFPDPWIAVFEPQTENEEAPGRNARLICVGSHVVRSRAWLRRRARH